jgi:hypothetical protein
MHTITQLCAEPVYVPALMPKKYTDFPDKIMHGAPTCLRFLPEIEELSFMADLMQ